MPLCNYIRSVQCDKNVSHTVGESLGRVPYYCFVIQQKSNQGAKGYYIGHWSTRIISNIAMTFLTWQLHRINVHLEFYGTKIYKI